MEFELKLLRRYSIIVTILLIICLFVLKCERKNEPALATENTKEIKGRFKTQYKDKIVYKSLVIPNYIKVKDTKTSDSLYKVIQNYNDDFSFEMDRFIFENDSLKKLTLFKNAIEPKQFSTDFDNKDLTLNISGVVAGSEIKEITPKYTIKPIKIKSYNKILVGGGFGSNKALNQVTYKANVSFQNKKNSIYRISYQRIGTQEFGLIEYDLSLFKF